MMSKDKVLRKLYPSEIEDFASRRGTNKTAVKDFLGIVELSETPEAAIINLKLHSDFDKWNKATMRAIEEGINRAIKRPVKL